MGEWVQQKKSVKTILIKYFITIWMEKRVKKKTKDTSHFHRISYDKCISKKQNKFKT